LSKRQFAEEILIQRHHMATFSPRQPKIGGKCYTFAPGSDRSGDVSGLAFVVGLSRIARWLAKGDLA
jgi:hypothetical protein